MFEWKVEDMILLNDDGGLFLGKEKIYSCESTTSKEDKIAFVDSMNDGKLSYILKLVEKFNKDKADLSKDRYGSVKTVSLKAWIKRNDDRKILDDDYHYGNIRFIVRRNIANFNSKGGFDVFNEYIDEAFHQQLKKCEQQERQYFLEHDEYSILKEKFRNRGYGTTFGVNIAMCSDGEIYVYENKDNFYESNSRPITIDELKELLSKYEQLDTLVEKLTKETKIVY